MKYAFGFFCLLYLLALMLFLVGTFGWFGQERDPLSGIFLLPLGLPWNIVGDRMGLAWRPDPDPEWSDTSLALETPKVGLDREELIRV